MNLKERLHYKFLEKETEIQDWFSKHIESKAYPFYCSFDIRESNNKLAPVDANLFPAGFNNICQDDRDAMGELLKRCTELKSLNFKNIAIFCESHTNNPYYWDNVRALITLFESEGFKPFAVLPDGQTKLESVESASGAPVKLNRVEVKDGETFLEDGTKVDFILSNNDFSSDFDSWIKDVKTPQLPLLKMGWHKRRKNTFFEIYNELVEDFSKAIGMDPFHLRVETYSYDEFDIEDKGSLAKLSGEIAGFKEKLSKQYKDHGVEEAPYFFVKNSFGTYGLGVVEVKSPEDVLGWNYKARKKMKATKGGGRFNSVIIQEGIPTTLKVNESPAEAVIYLLGCGLAGGFLRTNERKGDLDSLNAPGAVFKRMCFSDYEFQKENKILENVYGTVARLGALALSLEIERAQ
ncbi:MAG: glutamate--cysteine ligase [Bdellovibrionales bacterium]